MLLGRKGYPRVLIRVVCAFAWGNELDCSGGSVLWQNLLTGVEKDISFKWLWEISKLISSNIFFGRVLDFALYRELESSR